MSCHVNHWAEESSKKILDTAIPLNRCYEKGKVEDLQILQNFIPVDQPRYLTNKLVSRKITETHNTISW